MGVCSSTVVTCHSFPIYFFFPFVVSGGNPCGVCLLSADIPDSDKQRIAEEVSMNGTAFVTPAGDRAEENGEEEEEEEVTTRRIFGSANK